MMENAMITMKNINKGYMLGEERLPILKDINFQVNKGEYYKFFPVFIFLLF